MDTPCKALLNLTYIYVPKFHTQYMYNKYSLKRWKPWVWISAMAMSVDANKELEYVPDFAWSGVPISCSSTYPGA